MRKFLDVVPDSVITCPICLEEINYKSSKRVKGCPICCAIVCGECSIKQFVANQGIVVCCTCRHSVGNRMPAYLVKETAEFLRLKYKKME